MWPNVFASNADGGGQPGVVTDTKRRQSEQRIQLQYQTVGGGLLRLQRWVNFLLPVKVFVVFQSLPADLHLVEHLYNSRDEQRAAPGDALHCLLWQWLFSPLTLCFVSALTELGDMEGYGHVYIGPFNPALCHAASLLAEHWEAGLASPGCLDTEWPNLPPITPPTRVLFTVLRFFRWAHVAVISGDHSSLSCGVGVWLLQRGCVQLVTSQRNVLVFSLKY